MLTWHVDWITEIPIVLILAHIELSRLNILNFCLHFAATTLSQADFFSVCCIWCLLHCKNKAWRVRNELMVTPCSFKWAWCSKCVWCFKKLYTNCVMSLVATYAQIRFMGKLTTSIYLIYRKRVYCWVWIIPMESLGSILD